MQFFLVAWSSLKTWTSSLCGPGMLEWIPRLIWLNSLVFFAFPFFTLYLLLGFSIFNLWLLHINKKNMWLFLHHFLLSDKLHLCFSNWVDGMMYLMCFNYCLNRVKFGSGWYRGNIARRIKSYNHAAGISSLYRNFAASNPFYM